MSAAAGGAVRRIESLDLKVHVNASFEPYYSPNGVAVS